MDLVREHEFRRLLSRYERRFGEAPPFTSASLDEAIDYMRLRLADDGGRIDVPARPWRQAAPRGPHAIGR